jgi:hypothetical protein
MHCMHACMNTQVKEGIQCFAPLHLRGCMPIHWWLHRCMYAVGSWQICRLQKQNWEDRCLLTITSSLQNICLKNHISGRVLMHRFAHLMACTPSLPIKSTSVCCLCSSRFLASIKTERREPFRLKEAACLYSTKEGRWSWQNCRIRGRQWRMCVLLH